MSNNKVKGLLKGLRYISQIFDSEQEAEMQIGYPTDVKHVAHIGWDSPSANSPSWMNEFKTPPSFSSAPLSLPAPGDIKEDVPVKWVSEDSNRRGVSATNSAARNLPELPKSSRRQSSSGTAVDSPSPTTTREKSEKTKARRSSKSKDSSDQKQTIRRHADQNQGNDSPTLSQPDIPRNAHARRKKSSVGGSTRSKAQVAETYKSPFSDPGSGTGSISISKDTGLCQTP